MHFWQKRYVIAFAFFSVFSLSLGSALTCDQLSCLPDQTCYRQQNGTGVCREYAILNIDGTDKGYFLNSCLPERPKFLDSDGDIQNDYCFGADELVGTIDDCGCLRGYTCTDSGTCERACSDGTAPSTCVDSEDEKPRYCNARGQLIDNATACGCPEEGVPGPNGECYFERVMSTAHLFPNGFVNFAGNDIWGQDIGAFYMMAHGSPSSPLSTNATVLAPGCASPQILSDNKASLEQSTNGYKHYLNYCQIPASIGEDYLFTLNFSKPLTFNEVFMTFGYPHIINYQLEYYHEIQQKWLTAYTGKNDFRFSFNPTEYNLSSYTFLCDYQSAPQRNCTVYSDTSARNGATFDWDYSGRREGRKMVNISYNGKPYQLLPVRIDLPFEITTSQLRLRALNWVNGAKLYDLGVSRSEQGLAPRPPLVKNGPVYTQAFFSGLGGNRMGEFRSQFIHLDNVKSEGLHYVSLEYNESVHLVRHGSSVINAYNDSSKGLLFNEDCGNPAQAGCQVGNGHYPLLATDGNRIGNSGGITYRPLCLVDGNFGNNCVFSPSRPIGQGFFGSLPLQDYTLPIYLFDPNNVPTFNRIVLNEYRNRVTYIKIFDGTYIGTGAQLPILWEGQKTIPILDEFNVTTIIDLPFNVTSTNLAIQLAYASASPPLISELGLYYATPQQGPSDLNTKYQIDTWFRTGENESELKNNPWQSSWTYLPSNPLNINFWLSQFTSSESQILDNKSLFQYEFRTVLFFLTNPPNQNNTMPYISDVKIKYLSSARLPSPPTARIQMPREAFVGQALSFNASSSYPKNGITEYIWEFGDGINQTSTQPTVTHVYTSPRIYTLKLTIKNKQGLRDTITRTLYVDGFNCSTPDPLWGNNNILFPFNATYQPLIQTAVQDALFGYANARGVEVTALSTFEDKVQAALHYISENMVWTADDITQTCIESKTAYRSPTQQDFPQNIYSLSQSAQCGCGATYCGDCEDFSILFTTLVRAMNVNNKCIWSACSDGHCYNIINYHGKYRTVDPQAPRISTVFSTEALQGFQDANNVPYYLTYQTFNDKNGAFSEHFTSTKVQLGTDTLSRVANYPGASGIPDVSKRCSVDWTKDPRLQNLITLRPSYLPWDPATLFEEACP